MRPPEEVGDREVALDAVAVAVVGAAVCAMASDLARMSLLVPAVVLARVAAWLAWTRPRGVRAVAGELAFLAACTALGAANDWNSVVRHRVYAYGVPSDLAWSSIPAWMFLYWGLILRFVASLGSWSRLGERASPDAVRLGARTLRGAAWAVGARLALVLATRQAIYRWWDDPWLSWAPFAAALALYAGVFPLRRRERALAALFLLGGPAVEALFIQVGGLHRYALGWFAGVPAWIVLWWVLAVLVWADVAPRLRAALA